jgi:carbonic anhydrase/acetyltransferase-like protein (isoleucine patch superfamily)
LRIAVSGLILPWKGVLPTIDPTAFIAQNATIIGDTVIGAETNIWFGVVIRGDVHEIRIGARTNIQDGTIVHVAEGKFGTYIGDDVTIGHAAIIHACVLGSGSFVGMGACVLDGAVVESGAMVAAGALVTPGKRVPAGELWAGNPAKKLRDLAPADLAGFEASAAKYVGLGRAYRAQQVG